MCERHARKPANLLPGELLMAQPPAGPPGAARRPASAPETPAESGATSPAGSRRRRLWELPGHAHCPVVGVCLPLAGLRRLAGKVLGGAPVADDYELHCGVVTDCKVRTPLAEAVQRELDRRFERELREGSRLKTAEALRAWWQHESVGPRLAGVLWACLTHPRCEPLVEDTVLHDLHMIQHQVGAANRADLERLRALSAENAVLARQLAGAQRRVTQEMGAQSARIEQLQAALVRARADLIGRDTVVAQLWEQVRDLEAQVPDLKDRRSLTHQVAMQQARIDRLEAQLRSLDSQACAAQARADTAEARLGAIARADAPSIVGAGADGRAGASAPAASPSAQPEGLAELQSAAVLCVGGRASGVPIYRALVEASGGQFLHHDGGEEDNVLRLQASLAAADLVICQTGCVSHNAYWRVKDHCRRTGKACVFVEKPSRSSLARALRDLQRRLPGTQALQVGREAPADAVASPHVNDPV